MLNTIRLTVTFEDKVFNHTALDKKITLGRSSKCNFTIPLEELSREHCIIEVEGDHIFVTDLGSKNGTEVNNVRLIPGHRSVVPNGATVKLSKLYDLQANFLTIKSKDNINEDGDSAYSTSTVTIPLELSSNFKRKPKKPVQALQQSIEKDQEDTSKKKKRDNLIMIIGFLLILGYVIFKSLKK